MKPVRTALTAGLALLLAACAAKPIEVSMQAARNADYGRYPKDYQQHIRNYLDENLRDAGSAKIRITTPPRKVLRLSNQGVQGSGRAGWDAFYLACADVNLLDARSAQIRFTTPPRKVFQLSRAPYKLNGRAYYAVCVEVNAKNAYGGYTGWQTKMFRFKNNTIEGNPTGAYAACTSKDEIYIDTTLIFGGDQVNIVP